VKIKYEGPFDRVQIAVTGQWVDQGKAVEVEDAVAKSLLEQSDWKKVPNKKDDD
jgi:hypothetical protein